MGLRDQNNGKKIGINGSRIYHVTTLWLHNCALRVTSFKILYKQAKLIERFL